jgi:spore germination protein GerM
MAKQTKPSFGIVFWIALLSLVAVVYIGSRINLPQFIADRFGGDYRKPEISLPQPEPSSLPELEAPESSPESKEPSPPSESPVKTQPEPSSTDGATEKPARTRSSKLYFLQMGATGKPELISVERSIRYHTTPLTETIKELFKGPSPSEAKSGVLTLIPSGTALLSVSIRDGIAYINVNEPFRFNPYGIEGAREQIRQIVYTVTEFPGIKGVQLLVEGKKIDYLSPEGVYIGKPITRESCP